MVNQIDSLESIIAMIPVIKDAVPADLAIGVCDLKRFLVYSPGKNIDLKIKAGQALNPEEPLSIALREDKRLVSEVPTEYYGFEFTGTAVPLHDKKGNVIGGLAIQIRRQSELRAIADQIGISLKQANERIVNVASGSDSLAEYTQNLLIQSQQAEQNVKNSDEILSILKRVADQTNLLGLNAAIEAARAGEKGRGFEVVASEIRKFSRETVSSSQRIHETLVQIQDATKQIATSIEQIAAIGEEQAASTQEISKFVEEIQEMSNKLNAFAKKL